MEGSNLVDMIRENLVAERIAIETYRDLIRYFADKDPTTRVLLEKILAQEEDHANDMHDLLVSHEGRPDARSLVPARISAGSVADDVVDGRCHELAAFAREQHVRS